MDRTTDSDSNFNDLDKLSFQFIYFCFFPDRPVAEGAVRRLLGHVRQEHSVGEDGAAEACPGEGFW